MINDLLNSTLWILGGGLFGWLAFALLTANAHWGLALNLVAGIGGATCAGWIYRICAGPVRDMTIYQFTLHNPVAPLGGALFAIAVLTVVATAAQHKEEQRTRILLH